MIVYCTKGSTETQSNFAPLATCSLLRSNKSFLQTSETRSTMCPKQRGTLQVEQSYLEKIKHCIHIGFWHIPKHLLLRIRLRKQSQHLCEINCQQKHAFLLPWHEKNHLEQHQQQMRMTQGTILQQTISCTKLSLKRRLVSKMWLHSKQLGSISISFNVI